MGNKILHISQNGIFCLKAVIIASSYGVSNSGPADIYMQREQATMTALRCVGFKCFVSI